MELPPVFARRDVHVFFELAGEVVAVIKPDSEGNVGDGAARIFEQLLRVLDASADEVLERRVGLVAFEGGEELAVGEAAYFSESMNIEGLGVVLLDIAEDTFDIFWSFVGA